MSKYGKCPSHPFTDKILWCDAEVRENLLDCLTKFSGCDFTCLLQCEINLGLQLDRPIVQPTPQVSSMPIGNFLKIWKCQASAWTCHTNQFPCPSCHCHTISKLAWVLDRTLRQSVAKLEIMAYWLNWDKGNDLLCFLRNSFISLCRSAQS